MNPTFRQRWRCLEPNAGYAGWNETSHLERRLETDSAVDVATMTRATAQAFAVMLMEQDERVNIPCLHR
jgi:hypothetical protein